MNLRSRLLRIEEALNPPEKDGSIAGLADRMRTRLGVPPRPVVAPRPGGLAYRMQQRAARRVTEGLL